MAKVKVSSTLAIYTNDGRNVLANSAGRKLIISTHGGWQADDGWVLRSEINAAAISFYSNENFSLTANLARAMRGAVQTIDTPLVKCKNYELSRFEHDPKKSALEPKLNDQFDVLKVRTKWFGERSIHLKNVIQALQNAGYQYPEYCCLFCRYTGNDDLVQSARQRTNLESERLTMMSKQSAITAELNARKH